MRARQDRMGSLKNARLTAPSPSGENSPKDSRFEPLNRSAGMLPAYSLPMSRTIGFRPETSR